VFEIGNEDQKTSFLPRIVNGSLQITLACLEQNGDWSPNGITSTYKKIDNEFIVSGIKKYVPYGHSADKIIVIAREEGSNGAEGVSLFLVDSEEKNLEIKKLNTMDQTRPQSLINLNNVRISDDCVLGELGGGWNALEKLRLYGALGVSAEQVGGAQRCLDMTCDFEPLLPVQLILLMHHIILTSLMHSIRHRALPKHNHLKFLHYLD
jgi:alkylation response protein AidB-like acyl-CoA dehydrogenase